MVPQRPATDVPSRRSHRRSRVFGVIAVVLSALVIGALVALHTPPARRFVLSQVTQLLAAEHIELSTDELNYNLFDLSLAVRNIRVRSPDAPNAPPFATIDRARLELSLVDLLRRRYVIEAGAAEGVEVYYFVDEHGNDNVPRPPRDPEQPTEPLNYLIADLAMSQGRFRYEDRARQIDLTLPLSSLDVEGRRLTDRHTVRFEAAAGDLRVGDRAAILARLAGELDLGDDDLNVTRLDLDAEGSRLTLTGSLSEFDAPRADFTLHALVDASRATRVWGLADPVAGVLEIDATAKGPLATPALEARLKGSEISFRNIEHVQLAAAAVYDLTEKRATIETLHLRAPWGSVSGEGVVAVDTASTSRVRADVTGLDAASVMRAFDMPYRAATRVDARINAEWPGLEYLEATGDANVALTPTATRVSRAVIPVGGRIDISAAGGRIVTTLRKVRAAGADVTGRLTVVDAERLDGILQSRVADVGRTVSAAEALLGRRPGSLLPAVVTGSTALDARVGGTLNAPTVAAKVNAPALAVGRAHDIALTGAMSYAPATLTIERLDLLWGTEGGLAEASPPSPARVSAAGRVELSGSKRVDLTIEADAFELPELLRAANQTSVPAAGSLALHGKVSGTTIHPAADFTLEGSNLSAYDETWGSLVAHVNLAGHEVVLRDLVLDKPQPEGNGRLSAAGRYHLDHRSYTFDARSENLRVLGLSLPRGRQLRGDVQLTARGMGTVSAPAADMDLAVNALRLNDDDLGRLVVDATVANRQAIITASAERFSLDANAVVGVSRPYPTTAKVRVDNLDLAALPLRLETPLDGRLRATVDAVGELIEPKRARATATVEAFSGSWNGQPFKVDAPAGLRYAEERLAIDRLQLTAQDSSVIVSGALPLTDRAGEGALTVEAHANLNTLAEYAPTGTKVSGEGAVTLAGTVRGTLEAIDPDVVVTIENGLLLFPQFDPGLSNLNLRARIAEGEATIEQLAANWGAARAEASGRIPLEVLPQLPFEIPRKGGPATFKATVVNLDPAAVPGAPAGLTGRMSLDAEIAAGRADLAVLEGRVTFPQLELAFKGLTLAQKQPSRVRVASGVAHVEQFDLAGSVGTLAARGSVGFETPRPLDVKVDGNLNLAAITVFTDAVRAEGDTSLELLARGTLGEPELNGYVNLDNATVVIDDPDLAAERVAARLDLAGSRVRLTSLTGDLNGGTLKGSGEAILGQGGLQDVDVELSTDDVAFGAPLDLRSLLDSKLRVTRRDDEFVVDGQVTIEEAGLTEDINFDTGLLATLNERRKLDLTEERNPLLERVRFNVKVDTATPILVDNNLARAEIEADLRVLGTPYETGLSGRLTVLEGAEITLNERRYEAERGVITFTDERRILPSVDLVLNTSARNYDITLTVAGAPGDTETTLTSDPALPEPDIMALLVTGRTLDEMRGEEFEVAREQVLSYLAGRAGSKLGRGLEKATGLTEVRLEPNLIANETDPSARLTVGQELAAGLDLVYSTDLADSNDQIWVAEYDVTRRFQTRAVRQSDNSYRLDFRHDVGFGGERPPHRVRRQRPLVAELTVTGDAVVGEAQLRDLLGAEEGQPYDFFAVRKGVQRIEELYVERGYLQSRVQLDRDLDQKTVKLNLRVTTGPLVDLAFEGSIPPQKVQEEVGTLWHRGAFDTQRAEDSAEALQVWLMSQNHLQAKVDYSIDESAPNRRRVAFRIEPGARFQRVMLAFEGAMGIAPKELDHVIEDQGLERQLFTDPTIVTELLERFYREEGYLSAEIDKPRYEFDGALARVVIPIREGLPFTIRRVSTSGNAVIPTSTLLDELPAVAGEPFLPVAAENSLQRIRDLYWRRGYNDVRSDYELVIDRHAGHVDVAFSIYEGLQSVIADIVVEGNDKTSDRLVREQLELSPAQPLDLSALSRSRRNLYDTGAFSVIDITRLDLAGDVPGDLPPDQPTAGTTGEKPVRAVVAVREVQPIQLDYGASYDTERGVGGVFDISNHNSLGKARVIALRSRYDSQLREARASLSQPSLRYWPIQTTGTVYFRQERNPATELTDGFDVDRKGLSISQEMELGNAYVWSYGYRYERARTFNATPLGLDQTMTVSPLTSTLTREGRDEVLDATTGSFLSHAFSYSPSWLGSDLPFLKYHGQYFHYFPLRSPQRKPFTNEIIRPRLVYATGVRVGLAHGFGGQLPTSERFYAGGSSTLRGFVQNAVGPIGFDRVPAGGDALLVINNELRFPLVSIVDGVVFADVGSVFDRVSDFSLTNLRESAGVGLRVRTPWFLLRGDYGFVLDHRPGERRSRFYFSIGQAF